MPKQARSVQCTRKSDYGLGFCYECNNPVQLGNEVWGYRDKSGKFVRTYDGYLHHKDCAK